MVRRLQLLWSRRDLIQNLAARDLLARYKGSVLGVVWSLMHPLVLAGVYTVAFSVIARLSIPNYALFLLAGPAGMILIDAQGASYPRYAAFVGVRP